MELVGTWHFMLQVLKNFVLDDMVSWSTSIQLNVYVGNEISADKIETFVLVPK